MSSNIAVPSGAHLKSYLRRKNYNVPLGVGSEFTHSSLTGGAWNITKLDYYLQENPKKNREKRTAEQLTDLEKMQRIQKQELLFLKRYADTTADSLLKTCKISNTMFIHRTPAYFNFISERITPVFKYFIDLDFSCPDLETIRGFTSDVQLEGKLKRLDDKIKRPMSFAYGKEKIEHHRERYAFFQDILQRSNHRKLLEIVRSIQTTLKSFYPQLDSENSNAFQVLICLTTPKKIRDGGFGEGVHLIFPYLETDREQALNLRENMLFKLEDIEPIENEGWRKIFDEGVYNDNGGALRMLGSRKADSCKECVKSNKRLDKLENEKKALVAEINSYNTTVAPPGLLKKMENVNNEIQTLSKSCLTCKGERFLFSSRIYWPEYYLDSAGDNQAELLDKLLDPTVRITLNGKERQDNFFRIISLASHRTSSQKPNENFAMPTGSVYYVPTRTVKRGARSSESRGHKEDLLSLNSFRNKKLFAHDHPWHELFEKLIRRKFGDFYKDVTVSKIFLIPDAKTSRHSYLLCLAGPGSNYCLNANKDHRTNTVFFMISPMGIFQKCHCKCDTMRPSGKLCKFYASPVKNLRDVPHLLNTIYPPLFHGEPWFGGETEEPEVNNGKYHQPPGFLDILWNRIITFVPMAGESGNDEVDITKGDKTLTPSKLKLLEDELTGSTVESLDKITLEDFLPKNKPKQKKQTGKTTQAE